MRKNMRPMNESISNDSEEYTLDWDEVAKKADEVFDYTETTSADATYIAPNGRYVDANDANTGDAADGESSIIHVDLWVNLFDYLDGFDGDEMLEISEDIMHHMENVVGWIRCNTGLGASDDRRYVSISKTPTAAQYRTLEDYIDNFNMVGKLMVYCEHKAEMTYDLSKYDGKYIVKRIQRYFTSGKLLESKQDAENFKKAFGDGLASRFEAVRKILKSPQNDYYFWIKGNDADALEKAISDAEGRIEKNKKAKNAAKGGAELVASNSLWSVYKITSWEAAKKYGRGTTWCISMLDDDYYWNCYTNNMDGGGIYSEPHGFFFYIPKRKGYMKYAVETMGIDDLEAYRIYDEEDCSVTGIPNAINTDSIPQVMDAVGMGFNNYFDWGAMEKDTFGAAEDRDTCWYRALWFIKEQGIELVRMICRAMKLAVVFSDDIDEDEVDYYVESHGLTEEELNRSSRSDEMKSKQEDLGESALTEMVGKDRIEDGRTLGLVEKCRGIVESCGYKIGDDIEYMWGDAVNEFGTMCWPKSKSDKYKLVLNIHMKDEPEEAIMNTICHELCHYVNMKIMFREGIIFWSDWKEGVLLTSKKYKPAIYSSHGKSWRDIAAAVSKKLGTEITRTDSYQTHTGVGEYAKNSYKYVVRCTNCGWEVGYMKKTSFAEDPNQRSPYSGRYKYACPKCHASGKFETIKNGK